MAKRHTTTDTWMICPICSGHGQHVNPNIDAQGLTSEDFDDEDFAEGYREGRYDVLCATCTGTGKILRSRWRTRRTELAEAAADRRLAAQEDGNWEAYQHASDWRYGA